MLSGAPIVPGQAALDETKMFARIFGNDEDALAGRLLGSAAELCELFTGRRLLRRGFEQVLPASSGWMRLGATPVRAITGVFALSVAGEATALAADAYAVDIDANGDGWVRVLDAGAKRVRVDFEAGLAGEWSGLPEALRHGIVRLAAHLYMERGGSEEARPPAAVTALWRPWRRMGLASPSTMLRLVPLPIASRQGG